MDKNAIKEIRQEHNGRVFSFPFGVLARNVETDADHRFLTDREKQNLLDTAGGTVVFEAEPATRRLLESGSRPGKLFPWVNRWLRDLKQVSFTGSYTDLINRPTLGAAAAKGVSNSTGVTQEGYVADARVIKTVNDKFSGMSFEREGSTVYVVYKEGADTVRKKLGSGLGSLKKFIYRERQGTSESEKLMQIVDGDDTILSATDFSGITVSDYFEIIRDVYDSKTGSNNYSRSKWIDDYKFNLARMFPDDYRDWTEKNFTFQITDSQMYCYHESSNNLGAPKRFQRTYTYDPANGALTVHGVTGGSSESSEVDNAGDGVTNYYVYGFELLIIT